MQSAAHQEKYFQQYIIDRLVDQGWKLGDSKFYDTERAVYPEDLESWIKTSGQQEKWDKLERLNGAKTLEVLMARLDKALELGATTDGDPGERAPGVYFAYFRDLDGNKLCAYKFG